jgi:hypothetical protein
MKKLLTERTFKRLLKTFINENINDISSDSIRNWVLKNFNKNANTNYDPDYLAKIAIDVLKLLKPKQTKLNGKTIDLPQVKTDEELQAIIKLINDEKARLSSTSIGGFGNVNKSLGGVDFTNLTTKEKFKLLKQYHAIPQKLFPNTKYIPISDSEFQQIEQAFNITNDRSANLSYAVWYTFIVFNGIKKAEDAPLINQFIQIYNDKKDESVFPMDPLKIKIKYDFDKFYDIASEIQNKGSGIDASSGAAHVSKLIKKYPNLYKGDFKDEKYGNTYAFFLIPILKEDEIDIYQPILREIGRGSTWCFAYGWADGKMDNKTHIRTYCTQDTTRILINKADPFNSVNGKFAMNKVESQFMNINDDPVLG